MKKNLSHLVREHRMLDKQISELSHFGAALNAE